jgi:hypothetical protein
MLDWCLAICLGMISIIFAVSKEKVLKETQGSPQGGKCLLSFAVGGIWGGLLLVRDCKGHPDVVGQAILTAPDEQPFSPGPEFSNRTWILHPPFINN